MLLKAKNTVIDEDWKTALAHHKPAIPKGALVKFLNPYTNYYGHFYEVEYNDTHYYVKPSDFEEATEEDIKQDFERKQNEKFNPDLKDFCTEKLINEIVARAEKSVKIDASSLSTSMLITELIKRAIDESGSNYNAVEDTTRMAYTIQDYKHKKSDAKVILYIEKHGR